MTISLIRDLCPLTTMSIDIYLNSFTNKVFVEFKSLQRIATFYSSEGI